LYYLSIQYVKDTEVIVSAIKGFRTWCERGQALAEYMPTMAGAMAISVVLWLSLSGGVKNAYCEVVDAFIDTPDACIDDSTGENPGDDADEGEDEDKPESSCIVTLSGAGSNPADWSREWDGKDETLTIVVEDLGDHAIPWSVSLRVPATGEAVPVGSGTITADGSYPVTIHYPAEGDWGELGDDGKHRSHASLSVDNDLCASADWERWYTPLYSADLAITSFVHEPEPICSCDKYTMYVDIKNNGPNEVPVYLGQGAIVQVALPPCVDVLSVTPSKGTCDDQVYCDLGAMAVNETAEVEVHVINEEDCDMTSVATVSAARPPDPDLSNNTYSDTAHLKAGGGGVYPSGYPH
jgi:hypothetical protein